MIIHVVSASKKYFLIIFFLSLLERYRIQSEQFEDLWLITNELIIRLKEYFEKQGIKDFSCSFSGSVPLQEYFELIDHHFEVCMIRTHIIYNFSMYERERDATEVRVVGYMLLDCVLQVVILLWMAEFVNPSLASCSICDQLQTVPEWLLGAKPVVWPHNRTDLIFPHGGLTFDPSNPVLKLFEFMGSHLAN